jgi:hypothetical protein
MGEFVPPSRFPNRLVRVPHQGIAVSNFRVPHSGTTPPGVPPNRPGQPQMPPAPPSFAQPAPQPPGPFGPALPPRPGQPPRQPPIAGVRAAQPGTLRKLWHFLNSPRPNAAQFPQPGNVAAGPHARPAPLGNAQPYPSGGPGTPQPYAQPYLATTQPNRGPRYIRAALIGGGLFAAMPSLQVLAMLPSGAGGLGAGTLLGYGIPIIVHSFIVGAGLGAATSAIRKRVRDARAQQLAGQGPQPDGYGRPLGPMPPLQQPGGAPPAAYAPPPVGPWGAPQPYPGDAGAPAQWPGGPQLPTWLPPGGPAAAQPPRQSPANRPQASTFGSPQPPNSPPNSPPAQPAAPRSPANGFGPPPAGYVSPAPAAQQAGYMPPPAASPQYPGGHVAQPMGIAQPAFPNNASGATTPAEILERFAPEKRKEVFDQMFGDLLNYPVASQRAPGLISLAQAIPLLSDEAATPSGRVDEKLIAFRMLHAERKNLSPRGQADLSQALGEAFVSLSPQARAALFRRTT